VSAVPVVERAPAEATARKGSDLRPEIQLLRAVAVSAVIANHFAPGLLPGGYIGVDIFFVISGYLITAHLLRELDGSGRVRLGRFWARRARRLLPASLLVLAVSALAIIAVVPQTQWPDTMRQVAASALYVQNWALALDAQDYFASSASPSPVTHYWSLSVEEQFYLLWPLLAFGAYALGRRWARPRAAVVGAFAVVVVASLVFSIVATVQEPNAAYFVTPARMWQLGIGGLLALAPGSAALRAVPRGVLSAVGWVLLVGSAFLFDHDTAVPGWITLLPVLGTAAVIWAGSVLIDVLPRALEPLLAVGLWIGAASYSLYLWHWPPVVLVPFALHEPLTPLVKLVVLAGVVVLSWLSLRFVETPVRTAPRLTRGPLRRTFVPALVGMAVVVTIATVAPARVGDQVDRLTSDIESALASNDRCFAARAMANRCEDPHRLRYPDSPLLTVDNDPTAEPANGSVCIQGPGDPQVETCEFGVPSEEAAVRVALVGDSHARHWSPALDELAQDLQWHVTTYLKGSCPANAAPVRTKNFPEWADSCHEWNESVAEEIAGDDEIDLVVTSNNSRNYLLDDVAEDDQLDQMAAGYAETWRTLTDAGKPVVVIGDVPQMRRGDIPTCVAAAGEVDDPCTSPARDAAANDPMLLAAEGAGDPGVTPVSLRRFFCNAGVCHSVIGGIVAYGDEGHILGFFARSLAPYLLEAMQPALRDVS
jgi:peptidoglycan/LPS O-acetylase OafA/YrhL